MSIAALVVLVAAQSASAETCRVYQTYESKCSNLTICSDQPIELKGQCADPDLVRPIYAQAGLERIHLGFDDSDPTFDIGATRTKDFRSGEDSFFSIKRKGNVWTAALRRARTQAMPFVNVYYREHGLDEEGRKGVAPGTPITLPSLNAIASLIPLETLETDSRACPALLPRLQMLNRLRLDQLERPLIVAKEGHLLITVHPWSIALRIQRRRPPLRIDDSTMNTRAFEWVMDTAEALEPCWRSRT